MKRKAALEARVLRFVRAVQDSPRTEGNDTTSDPELQSSDSKDDLEDDAQSDCSEMDGFLEPSHEVMFVPDADVERVTVKQVVNTYQTV